MRVAVIGAGAWGTSLAHLLADKGREVMIWSFEDEVADQINREHENGTYLGGVRLCPELKASSELAEAVTGAGTVVMVTPSHHARRVASELAGYLAPEATVVTSSKGIEFETLKTMTPVLSEALGRDESNLAVLSGPSFAREVALGTPTAVTVAAYREKVAEELQELFMTDRFRVYTSTDVIGAELGGALKNVMAIAAGIVAGLGLGKNTLAALITRGLAEMSRLGAALGAEPLTFLGLAGVGDLVLTCTSSQSRNQTVGQKLGQGLKLEEILAQTRTVAEGVKTSRSAHRLAQKHGVEMPICAQVYAILHEGADPNAALAELMTRDAKLERWGL